MRRMVLAPLPRFKDLLSLISSRSSHLDNLQAPWCLNAEFVVWFSRSAWSLLALVLSRQEINGPSQAPVVVWVPDYFCNETLAPLRDAGVRLVFYPLNKFGVPDLSACQRIAADSPPDIFVLVHYFGRPSQISWIRPFCQDFHCWLVEDAAHVLAPVSDIGTIGDAVLYSPHKHLPIFDGAALVIRDSGPSRFGESGEVKDVLEKVHRSLIARDGFSIMPALHWLFKRLLQKFGLKGAVQQIQFAAELPRRTVQPIHPKMTDVSRRLLRSQLEQLSLASGRRRHHHKLWGLIVRLFSFRQSIVIPGESCDINPYLFGCECVDESNAENVFTVWQSIGLPVLTWPDLPPEVLSDKSAHEMAIKLRHKRIYMPLHQSLSVKDIDTSGLKLLQHSTQGWRVEPISHNEWIDYWRNCQMPNMLQSWEYGETKETVGHWRALRYLIFDHENNPIGLVQVLVRTLWVFGGIARINRGPLLICENAHNRAVGLKLACLHLMLREAKRQHWWLLQVAPELENIEDAVAGMHALGFIQLNSVPWASGFLDLSNSREELYAALSRRWRRSLAKAEKAGVTVSTEDLTDESMDYILASYDELQSRNQFAGLDGRLIKSLCLQQSEDFRIKYHVARLRRLNGQFDFIGYRLIVYTRDNAFDLLVYSNDMGRQLQANSALYWHAILTAQHDGCKWFDIGGLSSETPEGIAEFKRGLNAIPYELVGEWRKIRIPLSSN